MKVIDFDEYSDDLLKQVSLKLRKVTPEDDKTLPSEIFDYINKTDAQTGNVYTRIGRCINLLNKQIILRFLK